MRVRDEEPTGAEQVPDSPRERRLELAVTILLAAAALLSAWCAYESSRFTNAEQAHFMLATRLQADANLADNQAGRTALIDLNAFNEWVDATASGDTRRATFHRERFTDEMKPAFDAWLASNPLENPDAAATPFELPEYRPGELEEAMALQLQAREASLVAEDKGAVGEKYLLAVVLLASALFLLGIQTASGSSICGAPSSAWLEPWWSARCCGP